MTKHSGNNERIKPQYLVHPKEAQRHSEPKFDAVATALTRLDAHAEHHDVKQFRPEQAVSFKHQLATQMAVRSGEKLSTATMYSRRGIGGKRAQLLANTVVVTTY